MPAALISKHEVLDRLTAAFRLHGYEGATLARLTQATGLVRASLYHYFPGGKEEMARAVLAHAGKDFEDLVLDPLRKETALSPRDRILCMSSGLDGFYEGGTRACLLNLMSVGDAGPLFAGDVQASLQNWIELVAEVLTAAGLGRALARQRAEDAIGAIQGALVMSRILGSKAPFQRVRDELPDRLLTTA